MLLKVFVFCSAFTFHYMRILTGVGGEKQDTEANPLALKYLSAITQALRCPWTQHNIATTNVGVARCKAIGKLRGDKEFEEKVTLSGQRLLTRHKSLKATLKKLQEKKALLELVVSYVKNTNA